jgi:dolichol-phosphate mannosyltransferase
VRTTILIPCFNEREGIPYLCEKLRPAVDDLGGAEEVSILFVDDGCSDGTEEAIRRHAQGLRYEIATHARNRGLGAALRTGFAACRTEELVVIDSDCSYDPTQIKDLIATLRSGADLVIGSCYHPKGEVVGVPAWRLFLSKTLSRMYSAVLPIRLYTYTSCFRAYRREVFPLLDLSDDTFLSMARIVVSAVMQGVRVVEIPARLTTRQFGQSKIKVVQLSLDHMKYFLRLLGRRLLGPTPRAASRRSAAERESP